MENNPYAAPQTSLTPEGPPPLNAAPALWNPDAAGAWSLLFSPIFGSILVMKNWAAIGDRQKVMRSRTWLLASIVSFVIQIYARWWALLYIVVWYLSFQKDQTEYVKAHWGTGYPRKGWRQPLLLAVFSFVALVVLITLMTS